MTTERPPILDKIIIKESSSAKLDEKAGLLRNHSEELTDRLRWILNIFEKAILSIKDEDLDHFIKNHAALSDDLDQISDVVVTFLKTLKKATLNFGSPHVVILTSGQDTCEFSDGSRSLSEEDSVFDFGNPRVGDTLDNEYASNRTKGSKSSDETCDLTCGLDYLRVDQVDNASLASSLPIRASCTSPMPESEIKQLTKEPGQKIPQQQGKEQEPSKSVESVESVKPAKPVKPTEFKEINEGSMLDLIADPFNSEPELPKLPKNREMFGLICFAHNPADFFIQPYRGATDFITTVQKAQLELIHKGITGWSALKEGMICCARFTVDMNWYRAKIVSITYNDEQTSIKSVRVFFIDYGNYDEVTPEYVMPMAKSLARTKRFAVNCCLLNSVFKESEWPKICTIKLMEFQSVKCSFSKPSPRETDRGIDSCYPVVIKDLQGEDIFPHLLKLKNKIEGSK